MRDIKFRGICIDDSGLRGEFVYGYYFINSENKSIISSALFYEVESETVGQFTGMLTNDSKPVYEGDIIRVPHSEFNAEIVGVVEFERGAFFLRSLLSGTTSDLGWVLRKRMPREPFAKIIGNIHENPELVRYGNQ